MKNPIPTKEQKEFVDEITKEIVDEAFALLKENPGVSTWTYAVSTANSAFLIKAKTYQLKGLPIEGLHSDLDNLIALAEDIYDVSQGKKKRVRE